MKQQLFLMIAAAALAQAAFAQSEADFNVSLTEDGAGVIITGYTGRAQAVKIPAAIQGMPVRQIGEAELFVSNGPFQGTGITSVIIPSGVTLIGQNAFSECTKLAQVTLPAGLTAIYKGAFYGCAALRTIVLPDSVTYLGGTEGSVFAYSGLTSITLSKGLKAIEHGTFQECERLVSVIIPEGVTDIREMAFQQCTALASVTLPSTLNYIGALAFSFCPALTTITFPDAVTQIYFDSDVFMYSPKLNLASQVALKKRGYTG